MGINRFTKYTAPEFIQTYDPYPMEKMMGLAQHQQKRFDTIDTAIGKAYGDANVSGGLSTESKTTADAINKDRNQQLDVISNDFAKTRDVRKAVQELSRINSSWKSDPRLAFLESDKALSPTILGGMNSKDFGTSLGYEKYNTNSREFTLGISPEQIASGYKVTPEDYNLVSTPGVGEAFKSMFTPLKADIERNRQLVAGGEYKDGRIKQSHYTYQDKSIDLDLIDTKLGPSLDMLSSDGVNEERW